MPSRYIWTFSGTPPKCKLQKWEKERWVAEAEKCEFRDPRTSLFRLVPVRPVIDDYVGTRRSQRNGASPSDAATGPGYQCDTIRRILHP